MACARTSGTLRRALIAALAAFAVLALAPAFARAASPLAWASPVRIDHIPPYASPVSINGMSCPSSTLCVATDNNGNILWTTTPTGSSGWTSESIDGTHPVTGVSCTPGTTQCVAIDAYGQVLTTSDPTAGGTSAWSTPTRVDGFVGMTSISCPTTSLCVATDRFGDVITTATPLGSASSWTVSRVDNGNSIRGVSCPSASLCVAVDKAGNVITSTNPNGGGTAWTVQTGVDPGQSLNSVSCSPTGDVCAAVDTAGNVLTSTSPTTGPWTSTNIDGGHSITSISCPADNLCVAVDGLGEVVTVNPSTNTVISGPTHIDQFVALDTVSCASSSLCLTGDALGYEVSTTTPSGAWNTPVRIDGLNIENSVSCSSVSLCVAVDNSGKVMSSTAPTGGSDAWKDLLIDSGQALDSVSCTQDTSANVLCVAVDSAGNAFESTNPGSATPTWTESSIDGTNELLGVSCLPTGTDTFQCVAVDDAGNVVTSSGAPGSAWTVQSNVDPGKVLFAVSCATTTLCVAVDNAGQVLTSTTPTTGGWTAQDVDGANQFSAISCTDNPSLLCAATDTAGNLATSTAPTASDSWTVADVDGTNVPYGVSCPSTTLCVIADQSGDALTSTNPTGGIGAWQSTDIDSIYSLFGVSCPTLSLCVAVDGFSNGIIGTPAAQPGTLNVAPAGTGSGTITGSGINCPNGCSNTYPAGTQVTLTATAASGSQFSGWTVSGSAPCSGTGTCTVTIGAGSTVSVSANFTRIDTFIALLGGNGSGTVTGSGINCPGTCSGNYPDGSTVTLTAQPAAGSVFSGWGGACSGTGTCVVTMNGDQGVVANFNSSTPTSYTLFAFPSGSGTGTITGSGLNCSSGCKETYTPGTVVTLTATATNGSSFVGWGGACSGTGTCTVTMSTDQAVIAEFAAPGSSSFGLEVVPRGPGGGTVTGPAISCRPNCAANYPAGTVVTLTATPAKGSVFSGWGGDCTGTGTCTVTMNTVHAIVALFTPVPNCVVKPEGNGVWLSQPHNLPAEQRSRVSQGTISVAFSCNQLALPFDDIATTKLGGFVTVVTAKGKKRFYFKPSYQKVRLGLLKVVTFKVPKTALADLGFGRHESMTFNLTATDIDGTGTAQGRIRHVQALH